MDGPLLSPKQAAAEIGCSVKTIYRAIAAGRLTIIYFSERQIRIAPDELAEAVRRGRLPDRSSHDLAE